MIGARIAQRRYRISVALAVVLPVAFVFFLVAILRGASPTAGGMAIADYSAPAVSENRPAPGFTLPNLAGAGSTSLDQFSGHPLVLTFWSSVCPPCRQEAPFLRMAWKLYGRRGIRFLGVDHRDDRAPAVAFATDLGLPFTSVYDREGRLAGRYAVFGLPTTFVIRPDGRIAYRITGRVDATNLRTALDRLLDSSGPAP
jgi:peroxiredoxin